MQGKYPELHATVNIWINYSENVCGDHNFLNRLFTQGERKAVPVMIAECVESTLSNSVKSKPSFIDRVSIEHFQERGLRVSHCEKFIGKEGFTELINKRILEKESKIDRYLKDTGVEKCWLLVVVSSTRSFSGFDLEAQTMEVVHQSKFEKIIVFDTFTGRYFIVNEST